jgi:hypothetical protein
MLAENPAKSRPAAGARTRVHACTRSRTHARTHARTRVVLGACARRAAFRRCTRRSRSSSPRKRSARALPRTATRAQAPTHTRHTYALAGLPDVHAADRRLRHTAHRRPDAGEGPPRATPQCCRAAVLLDASMGVFARMSLPGACVRALQAPSAVTAPQEVDREHQRRRGVSGRCSVPHGQPHSPILCATTRTWTQLRSARLTSGYGVAEVPFSRRRPLPRRPAKAYRGHGADGRKCPWLPVRCPARTASPPRPAAAPGRPYLGIGRPDLGISRPAEGPPRPPRRGGSRGLARSLSSSRFAARGGSGWNDSQTQMLAPVPGHCRRRRGDPTLAAEMRISAPPRSTTCGPQGSNFAMAGE